MRPLSVALLLGIGLSQYSGTPQSLAPSQPPPQLPQSTGAITGHVYDADTKLPLRYAQVTLIPDPAYAEPQGMEEVQTPQGKMTRPKRVLGRVTGSTDFDGQLHMTGVPPGAYLVAAVMSGYLPQSPSPEQVADLTDDQIRASIDSLPHLRIGADSSANIDISLHRGAVVAGTIRYGDGTPAAHAAVNLTAQSALNWFRQRHTPHQTPYSHALLAFGIGSSEPNSLTDDEGHFRIAGIRPGKYLLQSIIQRVSIEAGVQMSDGSSPNDSRSISPFPEMIPIFAPDALSESAARVFDIRGEEHITDADITLAVKDIYSVTVPITAGPDHHVPGFAMAVVAHGDDVTRAAQMEPDGTLRLHMLQAGSYTLRITAGDQNPTPGNPQTEVMFHTATIAFVITDHDLTLDPIVLVPRKAGDKPDAFPFF